MRPMMLPALLALLLIASSAAGGAETAPEQHLITSLPSEALSISEYYYNNQSVYDLQDNEIGDVNDILIDREGKVVAVMVGVGGFLGAAEKNVAVPFSALKVTEKDQKTYLVIDTTKEALERALGYSFDRGKRQWVPAVTGKQE